MAILISDRFDSGNIKVLDCENPLRIRLEIREDLRASLFQWFHFQVSNCKNEKLVMHITNASKSSYPRGWSGYETFVSYDMENWFRVPTHYHQGNLIIEHTSAHDTVFFAYFPPYSHQRHLQLLARCQVEPDTTLEEIGESADLRSIGLLRIGVESPNQKKIWIIGRQHPGETMGEWLIEGLLESLYRRAKLRDLLLSKMVFYIIPNMNPDGSILGNLRTNARGANLNREWVNPTLQRSPEVYWVRNRIHATGVDFFLDVHGDEDLPYCFAAGCEGVPHYSKRLAEQEKRFRESLTEINPDFQKKFGYELDEKGQADLRVAANYVCETFGCPALTLEMPFKENKGNPTQGKGWDHLRAKALGASVLEVLEKIF